MEAVSVNAEEDELDAPFQPVDIDALERSPALLLAPDDLLPNLFAFFEKSDDIHTIFNIEVEEDEKDEVKGMGNGEQSKGRAVKGESFSSKSKSFDRKPIAKLNEIEEGKGRGRGKGTGTRPMEKAERGKQEESKPNVEQALPKVREVERAKEEEEEEEEEEGEGEGGEGGEGEEGGDGFLWRCGNCDFTSRNKRSLMIHLKFHLSAKVPPISHRRRKGFNGIPNSIVKEPEKKIESEKEKRSEKRKDEGRAPMQSQSFNCNYCSYSTSSNESYRLHVAMHSADERNNEQQVEESDEKKEVVEMKNEGMRFKCTKCDYQSDSRSHFIRHSNKRSHKSDEGKTQKRAVNESEAGPIVAVVVKNQVPQVSRTKKSNSDAMKNDEGKSAGEIGDDFTKCPFCPYETCVPRHMKDHRGFHRRRQQSYRDKELPFACPSCDYRAIAQHDLTSHQHIHDPTHKGKWKTNAQRGEERMHNEEGVDEDEKVDEREEEVEEEDNEEEQEAAAMGEEDHHDDNDYEEEENEEAEDWQSESRSYPCSVCGKHFRTAYMLRNHSLVHTGERPFKCPDCSMDFPLLARLTSHAKKHSNPAAFACDLCDYTTYRKDTFNSHRLRAHHIRVDKDFKCALCSYSSQIKGNLVLHMAKYH